MAAFERQEIKDNSNPCDVLCLLISSSISF